MNKHRFQLHLPDDVWQRLKALAGRNRRAVTQEIILAVEAWLEESDDVHVANKRMENLERNKEDWVDWEDVKSEWGKDK